MKLKELRRTVNASWSPSDHHPVMIAAGSAAQQVDESFSSNSLLELYALNLEDPGLDFELKSSIQTQHKFQNIVWSGAGIIVGGCDGGLLEFYSADKLLKNANDSLIGNSTKHNGHISALDINPYQKNLLASGASESEIFIWDLNNTSQPMAPGNRSQPHEQVQGLAWNQQVQHILGSTFSTRCVVWDLRKNEPIMKLSDSQSNTRWRSLAWHPEVATQLCIASDDDQAPVIQLWDLRLASSPLATLSGHTRGVTALSWSAKAGMLLSASRDGRLLCWVPGSGEAPSEVCGGQGWVSGAAWSPRSPGLLLASAGGALGLHCLLPVRRADQTLASQSSIAESFGGLALGQLPAVRAAEHAEGERRLSSACAQPSHPPRFLARPAAARFAYGGKLVTFERCPQEAGAQKLVYVSQVVTDPELVQQAGRLLAALAPPQNAQDPQAAAAANDRLAEYCLQRGDAARTQADRYTWFFLRAHFLGDFRAEALNLLGFKEDEITSKLKNTAAVTDSAQLDAALSRGESTETEAELSTDTSADMSDAQTLIEQKLANLDALPAVSDVVIPTGEDAGGAICRALAAGRLERAAGLCLARGRVADALVIASLGGPEVQRKVQRYHLSVSAQDPVSLLAGAVLTGEWARLVAGASVGSWRPVLGALLALADLDHQPRWCEALGDKLRTCGDAAASAGAGACYVCALSPEALAARGGEPAEAAEAAELALLMRRAAATRGRVAQWGAAAESKVKQYAAQLSAQGALDEAGAVLRAADCRSSGVLHAAQPQPQPMQQNRTRTFSSQSQKRGHLPHNDITSAYNTTPGLYEQGSWMQSSVPAPGQGFPPQPHQPHQSHQTHQPHQPHQPQPPPSQPPRPGSVGSHSGGLTTRSKYKVDPSVQAAPLYNQYSFNNNSGQNYNNYNSPLPDQYSSASVPNPGFNPVSNSINPVNQVMAMNPMNSLNPVAPVNPGLNTMNTGLNQMNPGLNPVNPGLNPVNPGMNQGNPGMNQGNPGLNQANQAVNGGYYAPAQEAVPPPKPMAPGWNDPPMPTKPKPKQEVQAQAPITHPLFGAEPPQHIPLTGPSQYQPYQNQSQQYPGQAMGQQYPGQAPAQQYPGQPQSQGYPGNQYPGQQQPQQMPGQFQEQMMNQTYQGRGADSPAAPAPAPVPKPPIPEQFASMVNVFESLREECYKRADSQQTRRKLEDVQRRLETLYDMLRENRLSESALGILQRCASLAAGGAMDAAAEASSALAAGAEFATVAGFLPALRALLHLAARLQLPAH